MNVDDSTRKGFQHWRLQHSHESSERNQFDLRISQHSNELHFGRWLEPCPELSRRQISVWNRKLTRNIQNGRMEHIGNDYPCLSCDDAVADCFQNRPAIRSFAGTKNSNRQPFHFAMPRNFSMMLVVEYPFSNGTMSIFAPSFSSAARSSALSVSDL